MPRPYQSRINVADDYLEAAGQALFNFAYAEGIVAYLVDTFVPGYINLTRGRCHRGRLAAGVCRQTRCSGERHFNRIFGAFQAAG